jgi:hypothetical protein
LDDGGAVEPLDQEALPMRISAFSDDPGYVGRCFGVKVFFNGIERDKVFTADEEKRLIVVPVLDEDGSIMLNKERTEILQETLYGDVRVELPQ